MERARQIRRTVFHRQREGLLVGQLKRSLGRIVGHVASGRLRGKPFPDVSLVGIGFLGKLGGGHRPGAGHGFVQPQLFADEHQSCVHRRAKLPDYLP